MHISDIIFFIPPIGIYNSNDKLPLLLECVDSMLVIASCVHWDAQPKPEVLVWWIGLLPSGLFRLTPVFSYFLTDMNQLYVFSSTSYCEEHQLHHSCQELTQDDSTHTIAMFYFTVSLLNLDLLTVLCRIITPF